MGSVPGPRWGLCPQTPVIGSCSALAMVPPQTLTPSAAYDPLEKNPVGAPGHNYIMCRPRCITITLYISVQEQALGLFTFGVIVL